MNPIKPAPTPWKSLLPIAALLVGCGGGGGASAAPSPAPAPAPAPVAAPAPLPTNWTLVWSDEFDGNAGTAPSSANWNSETGNAEAEGWGNHELEYYTTAPRNAALDGSGNLIITAQKATNPGPCWNGAQCGYTSARLTTANKVTFTYGKVEARINFPGGQGIWPAFWALGDSGDWPARGEIDILEYVGKTPLAVYGTAHGPGYSGANGIGKPLNSTTPWAGGWHTFTLVKQPNLMVWLVDGVELQRLTPASLPVGATWAFERKFFVILNLAVGGDWPGSPDANTVFPAQMKVDWVRIYKEN
jgi:beta-glucanase (GH16 family)